MGDFFNGLYGRVHALEAPICIRVALTSKGYDCNSSVEPAVGAYHGLRAAQGGFF